MKTIIKNCSERGKYFPVYSIRSIKHIISIREWSEKLTLGFEPLTFIFRYQELTFFLPWKWKQDVLEKTTWIFLKGS